MSQVIAALRAAWSWFRNGHPVARIGKLPMVAFVTLVISVGLLEWCYTF